MDLKTIKRKLAEDLYRTVGEVYLDIDLIIANSLKYNELNTDFIRLTKNFQKSYVKIKRDCERYMRRLKNAEAKGITLVPSRGNAKKYYKERPAKTYASQPSTVENKKNRETNSSYKFEELSALAKRIRKQTADEQIELFRRIGIENTLTIDLKELTTK